MGGKRFAQQPAGNLAVLDLLQRPWAECVGDRAWIGHVNHGERAEGSLFHYFQYRQPATSDGFYILGVGANGIVADGCGAAWNDPGFPRYYAIKRVEFGLLATDPFGVSIASVLKAYAREVTLPLTLGEDIDNMLPGASSLVRVFGGWLHRPAPGRVCSFTSVMLRRRPHFDALCLHAHTNCPCATNAGAAVHSHAASKHGL